MMKNKISIFNFLTKVNKSKKSKISKFDREKARAIVLERLNYFNQFYNYSYKKVFIRNQKTRWGSCSIRGNLNFSYKIIYLNDEMRDYLIVHELCHLREFNHSHRFWSLVEQQIPQYSRIKNEMRRIPINKL